jgi:hypothetical protein
MVNLVRESKIKVTIMNIIWKFKNKEDVLSNYYIHNIYILNKNLTILQILKLPLKTIIVRLVKQIIQIKIKIKLIQK